MLTLVSNNTFSRTIKIVLLLNLIGSFGRGQSKDNKFYFVTASNHRYFYRLINLIGSLHKTNFDQINTIAIFNLGLEKKELDFLNTIEKVSIHQVEMVHPDILTDFATRSHKTGSSKPVPGWYSWKPVIIKQSLELFPTFLYLDAGSTVKRPLDILFEHILYTGYFLHCGASRKIYEHATQYVKNIFELEGNDNKWILNSYGLETGIIGVTSIIYPNLILPIYEMAKELRPFIDDGTCPNGFGNGRHEQTLFSILALKLGLKIHYHNINPKENFELELSDRRAQFNIACPPNVTEETYISCSRTHYYVETYFSSIHFKKNATISNVNDFKNQFPPE